MSFNIDLLWKRLVPPACFLLCLFSVIAQTQTTNSNPVKLAVQTTRASVAAGETVKLNVVLQNTDNEAVKATKAYLINLEIRQPSGKTESMQATIYSGETATTFKTQLNEPGLVTVRARHPELLEGSMLINVKSPVAFKGKTSSKPAPISKRKPKPSAFSATQLSVAPGASFRFDQDAPPLQLASLAPAQVPALLSAINVISTKPLLARQIAIREPDRLSASSVSSTKSALSLENGNTRQPLADGKDEARIQLFLTETLPVDLHVRLYSKGGKLDHEEVVIPKNIDNGEARLTSTRLGYATVKVRRTIPKVDLDNKELEIYFEPPITKIHIIASPHKIPLLESSDVVVQLKDENDRLVSTDKPRKISLTLDQWRGKFEPTALEIGSNSNEGRAKFTAARGGKVNISAHTESLNGVGTLIEIEWPTLSIILSALGGLLGGLVQFWRSGGEWWRIPAGAIIGIVVYGISLFGLLHLQPFIWEALQRAVVNSMGAFIISILGGFGGPELLSPFWPGFKGDFGLQPAHSK